MSQLLKYVLNFIEDKKSKITGSVVVSPNGSLISSTNKNKIRNDAKNVSLAKISIPKKTSI